ncbi:MAG: class I SAM-dependent methyltransferase [Bacteroidetes bacterium]|nr:MAG: class I SAM-dependent methyltransferase [Bacteroidota bacterium]
MEPKQNVTEFNSDVLDNGGYLYTNNAPYSAIVANKRIDDKISDMIQGIVSIKTIVDIGCGDGSSTNELKGRFNEIEFTGFDPASQAIELAKTKYTKCKFFVGNILDPSTFPQQKFDLAVMRGILHHLPTQQAAIQNSAALSKRLLIIEPNGNNPILKWIEKKSEYHIKHEEQSFTSKFLKEICIKSNFEIREMDFIGFVPFFFPAFPAKAIHFFQPLLENIPFMGKYFGAQIAILAEKK